MSSLDTIYDCTARQARELILDCFYAGLVPFLRSSPGMGKSALMASIFQQLRLYKIDHRVSQSDPTDFNGLPGLNSGTAQFHPFEELFPIARTPIPEGYDGFGIFLDEFNSGTKLVQAACFKLALDKMVGQHPLHPNSVIAMAGNLDTDRGITTQISTPMQSRLIHIRLRSSFQEWYEDVGLKFGYDHRILAYLSWKKEAALNDFRADHTNATFCCERTWEFMNALIKGKPITDDKLPLYVGTITPGVAVDFVQFTKVYDSIPDLAAIAADPTGIPVPNDTATRWAVTSRLADEVNKDTFSPIITYLKRFGIESRIMFLRSLNVRNPELHSHPDYIAEVVALSRYMTGGTTTQSIAA